MLEYLAPPPPKRVLETAHGRKLPRQDALILVAVMVGLLIFIYLVRRLPTWPPERTLKAAIRC